MTRQTFSRADFEAFKQIARDGRTAVEAFAQETGRDPLDCAVLLARGLAGVHDEEARRRTALEDEQREAAATARSVAKREWLAEFHALRVARGDYGLCAQCGRRGTDEKPGWSELVPRVTGEKPVCFFCGTVDM